MCKRPAAVAHRADIGEGDFQGFGLGRLHHFGFFFFATSHQHGRSHGAQGQGFQPRTFAHMRHEISFDERKKIHYEPGVKGLPSEAGILALIQMGFFEIKASTTMVAK